MMLYQYRGNIFNQTGFTEGFIYLKRLLKKGEIKFTSPAEFNDPFDCCPTHLSELPEENAFPHAVGESINQTMQSAISKIHGIVCFTPYPNKMLMWSHYGDQHRGICVGFDTELLVENSPTNSEGNRLFETIQKVEYIEKRPEHGEEAIFFLKAKEWKYEEEYRIISSMKKGFPKWGPGIWNIHKSSVKEIIIGARVPITHRRKIYEMVKACRPDIQIKVSVLHMKEFKLVIENYEDQPIIPSGSGYIHTPNGNWESF